MSDCLGPTIEVTPSQLCQGPLGSRAQHGIGALVVTEDVVVAVPDDRADFVMSVMTEKRIRHLPIVGDGGLAGTGR